MRGLVLQLLHSSDAFRLFKTCLKNNNVNYGIIKRITSACLKSSLIWTLKSWIIMMSLMKPQSHISVHFDKEFGAKPNNNTWFQKVIVIITQPTLLGLSTFRYANTRTRTLTITSTDTSTNICRNSHAKCINSILMHN